ncbi:MAG: aspartyl/asparaginyl beta-hydroxylase domain-containing protein, partial [Mesorhizobium sp.]
MSNVYDLGSDLVRRIYEKRIDAPAILDASTHFPNATKFAAVWQSIRDEALSVQL